MHTQKNVQQYEQVYTNIIITSQLKVLAITTIQIFLIPPQFTVSI